MFEIPFLYRVKPVGRDHHLPDTGIFNYGAWLSGDHGVNHVIRTVRVQSFTGRHVQTFNLAGRDTHQLEAQLHTLRKICRSFGDRKRQLAGHFSESTGVRLTF